MLGVPTGMVTMVGDDGFGKETIANFQSHGVDTSNVLTTDTNGNPTRHVGTEQTAVLLPTSQRR